jgi:hypothetical protein
MKEISFKQWRTEEAERLGITDSAMRGRYYVRKDYPCLPLRRVNKRVVLVRINSRTQEG